MKGFRATAIRLFGGVLALLFCRAPISQTAAQTSRAQSNRKLVIVELFTSEGCSSCPPADVLLRKLQEEQPIKEAEVLALEEHVDYWDHDGWTDPYSSSEWTNRQLHYAAVLKESQPYTPEMVVDGRAAFVGSDGRKAEVEIGNAARDAKTQVTITASQPDTKSSQSFTISVGSLAGNTTGEVAEVWLAVTEDDLKSSVSRGENAGHVLRHTGTLRSLQKLGVTDPDRTPSTFTGNANLKFNSNWNLEKLRVIVFVQEEKSRKILGAASTRITH